jgi:hypothetical protein
MDKIPCTRDDATVNWLNMIQTVVHTQCVDNVYLSNIKYVFYRNTSILLIDATYVMQNVVSHTYVIQDVF